MFQSITPPSSGGEKKLYNFLLNSWLKVYNIGNYKISEHGGKRSCST